MIAYTKRLPFTIVHSLNSWVDPETNSKYDDFMSLPYEQKKALGWRLVVNTQPEYSEFFSYLEISDWYHDEVEDVVKKKYTVVDKEIEGLKMALLLQLEETKHLIMGLGFVWNGRGVDTSEKSRALINGEYNAAIRGIRNESVDVFQFYTGPEHLTDAQVIEIGEQLRDFCQSIYIILNGFWGRILNPATTVEDLKVIKAEIEDKATWPTTFI